VLGHTAPTGAKKGIGEVGPGAWNPHPLSGDFEPVEGSLEGDGLPHGNSGSLVWVPPHCGAKGRHAVEAAARLVGAGTVDALCCHGEQADGHGFVLGCVFCGLGSSAGEEGGNRIGAQCLGESFARAAPLFLFGVPVCGNALKREVGALCQCLLGPFQAAGVGRPVSACTKQCAGRAVNEPVVDARLKGARSRLKRNTRSVEPAKENAPL
jgi:hypothetical protein